MKIIRMSEIEGNANPRGVTAKALFSHENARVMNLNLNAGDHVPHHNVPVDVFFYVVSGSGTIQIGNERSVVQAQDIVLCPPHTEMALWADQQEPFVVLNVKTPNF